MTKATQADFDVIAVLNIVDLCQSMRSMPLPGGLFDQDSLFIHLYEYISQLRNTRAEMDQRQEQANARVAKGRQR